MEVIYWVYMITLLVGAIIFGKLILRGDIIYIDGYQLDTKEKFGNYKCVIGEWDGNENDDDIFYYFNGEKDLQSFCKSEGRTDTEFVITKIQR